MNLIVLVISARQDDDAVRQVLHADTDYIKKPIDLREIEIVIREKLKQSLLKNHSNSN